MTQLKHEESERELTNEEKYWSLNGGFGMLAYCMELIRAGKVKSLDELREHVLKGMEDIHQTMTELQEATPGLKDLEDYH